MDDKIIGTTKDANLHERGEADLTTDGADGLE
jgi:hypothetical protein